MKEFRTLLKNSKKLKKCKRIASVCDSDEDKRVTWDELRICTGLIKGKRLSFILAAFFLV